MAATQLASALMGVPRLIGDIENELLDAPTPAPVTRQPLRVVVGDNVPLDLPPVLEEETEAVEAAEDDFPDVVTATPVRPLSVTPSIVRRRDEE